MNTDSTPITERLLPPAVDQAYQAYLVSHWGDLSNTPELAETMWNAGGRHAVKAMVIFGDIMPQLHRIEAKVKVLLELLESCVCPPPSSPAAAWPGLPHDCRSRKDQSTETSAQSA